MSLATGTVFNIQRFAIHDGPGVRTTVFLKGCPLSCYWCHNPEGQAPGQQIVYWESRCDACGECLPVCVVDALSLSGGSLSVYQERCTCCGRCVEACAADALQMVGREMTVAQVIAEIEKDRIFYDESGGGATFSGGEPLSQPVFLAALLRACREREIHTVVDTSGYAPAQVLHRISPDTGLFLFDLKLMDDRRHREFTGVSIRPVLENLRQLAGTGSPIALRFAVIPGVNDDEENVRAIAEFARSLPGPPRIDILAYHGTATEKYRRLHRAYPLSATQPPSAGQLSQIADTLGRLGLPVHVGG
jgi:pyruvate formate lyase activating enzyme